MSERVSRLSSCIRSSSSRSSGCSSSSSRNMSSGRRTSTSSTCDYKCVSVRECVIE